jgi:MFS family permease
LAANPTPAATRRTEPPERKAPPSLWRDRDFTLFCLGQGVSLVGAQFTLVAVPLLAQQTLGAGGLGLGLLQASIYAAYLVVPLFAGVLVDRNRKRPLLITSDAARFLLVISVPVLVWTGGLGLPLLCVIAFAVGCFTVLFEVAHMAYVPFLVSRERLTEANSWTTAAEASADTAGPGIAGLVVQATRSPAVALLADAFSYLVSVVTLIAIRRPEPAPAPHKQRNMRADMADGLRYVAGHRTLRALALQGLAFNCGSFAFIVAFLLHATSVQEAGAGWYGAALTAAGVGALLGATQVTRLTRRFDRRRVFALSVAGSSLPFFLVPAAAGPDPLVGAVWLAAFFLANIWVGSLNVMSYTLRQTVTPDELLGRMSASIRLVLFAAIPVGSLLGGVLSDAFSPRAGLLAGVLITTLSLIPLRTILASLGPDDRAADSQGTDSQDTDSQGTDR